MGLLCLAVVIYVLSSRGLPTAAAVVVPQCLMVALYEVAVLLFVFTLSRVNQMESRPVIPTRFKNDRVMEDVKAQRFALHKSVSASTSPSLSTPNLPFQLQCQKQ
ncbi:hypothetical protein C1H46_013581 [Malus baccata]|uniref:THH1/TOM1/TOM3 domain-containing protein n=1 Tax=Malus baccata TaxID=106549 RepID=A0A540MPR3_MALBA|nr:hypothetical protein C1H46_013581 [Malus baccata]